MSSHSSTFALVDDAVTISIDTRAYRISAVKKAAYRMASKFTAVIEVVNEERLLLVLRFKPGVTEAVAAESTRAFFHELLDQELREHVAEETGPVRALILAQAFSKTDLIRRE